jgi:hypothetical protein
MRPVSKRIRRQLGALIPVTTENRHTALSKPPRGPSVTNVTRFRATEIPLKRGAAIMLRRSGGPGASRNGAAGRTLRLGMP